MTLYFRLAQIYSSWSKASTRYTENHPYLEYGLIVVIVTVSSLIFYWPYLAGGDMDTVFRYWDGPNYSYLAKSLYDIPENHPLSPYTKPEYFAAHLPVYPLTIKIFSFMGYNNSMLFTTYLYTVLSSLVFFRLLTELNLVKSPLWSTIISLFLPARYLIYHNVGATEAPFIFFTLSSILAYLRGHYILAFILGGFSGITRITGILIGGAYFLTLIWQKKWKYIPALALVALPLLLVFTFYYFHYGNFFAYFAVNLSSANSLIHFKPLDIFLVYSGVGDTHSAEFYLAMYAVYGAGTLMMAKKHPLIFFYCLIYYIFSLFIFHQDLARYLIPIAPFTLVVAYDAILSRYSVRLGSLLFVGLAYLYAWKVIPHNLVVDWVYKDLVRVLSN